MHRGLPAAYRLGYPLAYPLAWPGAWGRFGGNKCLSLDGSGYASRASEDALNVGLSDFAVGGWIKTTAGGCRLYYKYQSSTQQVYVAINADGTLKLHIESAGVESAVVSSASFADGNWHYVFALVDGSSATGMKLLVDGGEVAYSLQEDPTSVGDLDNTGPLSIGSRWANVGTVLSLALEELWNFGYGGLPSDYAAYAAWRYANPYLALSHYDGGAWNGYADPDRSELVTNGDMELDSDWSGQNLEGGETNERSDVQAHGGTYSRHVVVDDASEGIKNSTASIVQGNWYELECWVYVVSGVCQINPYDSQFGTATVSSSGTGAWERLSMVAEALTTIATAAFPIVSSGAAAEFYVDDASIKRVGLVGDWPLNGDYTDETSNGLDLTEQGTGNRFITMEG